MRLLPLLAVLCLVRMCVLVGLPCGGAVFIERFGKQTAWSIGLFVLSCLFPAIAVAGLVQALRGPWLGVPRLVWVHALLVSCANLMSAAYLGYWGVIGWRTWL